MENNIDGPFSETKNKKRGKRKKTTEAAQLDGISNRSEENRSFDLVQNKRYSSDYFTTIDDSANAEEARSLIVNISNRISRDITGMEDKDFRFQMLFCTKLCYDIMYQVVDGMIESGYRRHEDFPQRDKRKISAQKFITLQSHLEHLSKESNMRTGNYAIYLWPMIEAVKSLLPNDFDSRDVRAIIALRSLGIDLHFIQEGDDYRFDTSSILTPINEYYRSIDRYDRAYTPIHKLGIVTAFYVLVIGTAIYGE